MGLALLGLVGSAGSWLIDGPDSAWFLPSIGLLLIASAAWGLWLGNKFMIAASLLTAGLTGLVASLFRLGDTTAGFTPYLFIPVILISGSIFGPLAPLLTVGGAMLATALVLVISQQFSAAYLQTLWIPFGLNIVVALLTAELSRYIGNLRKLSTEKNRLLRHYSQKSEQALQQAKLLQQRITGLEHQLRLPRPDPQALTRLTEQKNRLYTLISGAVHELNSTVGELEHIIESLEELPRSPAQTDFIEEAWKKIYHLTNLVVSLEEMARLENNEVSLQYREVDIAAMIRDAIGTAEGLVRNKDVTLRYQFPPSLPPLQADPLRLRQALLRLLSNAVKYTDEGLIEVETEVADETLTIRVSDTGIGINPDETDFIFDNFARSDEPASQYRSGPGLGLAISKKLVELHGGDIRVSSTPGIGSTFFITLPLTPPAPAAVTDAEPADEAIPAALADMAPVSAKQAAPEIEYHRPIFAADLEPAPIRRRQKGGDLGPVARFGPTYVMRFGLALLSMLVVVSAIVAFLAFYNRPLASNAKTSGTPTMSKGSPAASFAGATASPTATTATPLASVNNAGASQPSPTATPTPSPTASPTASPSPSPSPTVSPTATPVPSATPTTAPSATPSPTATPSPSPTPTATTPPPSATPTALAPTPLVTSTPLPTFTATSLPEPSATPLPASPTPLPRGLSYLISNSEGWHLETRPGSDPNASVTTIPLNTGNHNRVGWSAQERLVFAALEQGVYQIFTANADGSQIEQATAAGSDNLQPAWSPNGRQILFSSGRTGNFELFRANADGSNVTQLTNERGFDEWPVWSPTGQEIAFVSDRDSNEEIYVMNSDGSNLRRVTNHPADDWPAAWSPDGEQLVFASDRDGNWNLFIINVDGSGLQRLTNDPANEREPVWAGDGRIAFAGDSRGNWDIYTTTVGAVDTTRENWTQITNAPTDERYPEWLP